MPQIAFSDVSEHSIAVAGRCGFKTIEDSTSVDIIFAVADVSTPMISVGSLSDSGATTVFTPQEAYLSKQQVEVGGDQMKLVNRDCVYWLPIMQNISEECDAEDKIVRPAVAEGEVAHPQPAEFLEAARPQVWSSPWQQSEHGKEGHVATHMRSRSWCEHCVISRAKAQSHTVLGRSREQYSTIDMSFLCLRSDMSNEVCAVLVVNDNVRKHIERVGQGEGSVGLPCEGRQQDHRLVWLLTSDRAHRRGASNWCIYRGDPSVQSAGFNTIVTKSSKKSSQAIGVVERSNQEVAASPQESGSAWPSSYVAQRVTLHMLRHRRLAFARAWQGRNQMHTEGFVFEWVDDEPDLERPIKEGA